MLEPSDNSGSTPTPQEVGNPTDSRGIRSDLNRWVGMASGVVSTIGVATAWGEPHFPMLVGLWVVIGMASGVLGQLWQRPDANQSRLILLSTFTFVPLTSIMVFIDGGYTSPLWLVLLVGALSSSFSMDKEAYIALAVSALALTASMWAPPLLEHGFRSQDIAPVLMRTSTLVFVWVMSHRIIGLQQQEAQARLASEQHQRRMVLETAELRERTRQQQKMEALGRLAGGVAHDFNNLLTIILNVGAGLKEDYGDQGPRAAELHDLIEASEQAAALTHQLLRFSRGGTQRNESLEMGALIADVGNMLRRVLPPRIELVTEVSARSPLVQADRNEVSQVLMNLSLNSRDAIHNTGKIWISVDELDLTNSPTMSGLNLSPGTYVHIKVRDDGVGMTPEVKARAMEPFFTTKSEGRGTGIGLASSYTTATKYGGTMVLDSVAGKGTTVHVFLPRWYEPDPTEEVDISNAVTLAEMANPLATDEGLQVVVIDDEPGVRRIVTKLLQACGYVVTAFESPLEFLEKTDDGPHYDALVTDINMPGMSGVDLVRKLERSGRVRPTLFISGYFADDLDLQEFEVDCYGFLEKPLGKKTLNEALQDCIRRYREFRDGLEAPQF